MDSGASVVELDLKLGTLVNLGHQIKVVTVYSANNKIVGELKYEVIEEKINTTSQIGIQVGVYKLLKKYEEQADAFFIDGQVFLYGAGAYKLLGGTKPVFAHFNRELQAWPELVS